MATLEVLGDSVTYGIGDPEGGGWAARIRNTMMHRMEDYVSDGTNIHYNSPKRGIAVFNNARFGMTLPQIVHGLPSTLKNSAHNRGRLMVAVMTGFSDHVIPVGRANPQVPLPEFKENLDAFSTALKSSRRNTVPLFIELSLFDFTRPHPLNRGTFSMDRLNTYQEAVRNHAKETGGHFIEVADALRQLPKEADPISHDGIHPSIIGHTAIHNVVLQYLDDLLGERIA